MSKKKLSLNRETLTTLSPSELDGVHGGGWGAAIKTAIKFSKAYCRKTFKLTQLTTETGRPQPQRPK